MAKKAAKTSAAKSAPAPSQSSENIPLPDARFKGRIGSTYEDS